MADRDLEPDVPFAGPLRHAPATTDPSMPVARIEVTQGITGGPATGDIVGWD